jgi:hypothetical protein
MQSQDPQLWIQHSVHPLQPTPTESTVTLEIGGAGEHMVKAILTCVSELLWVWREGQQRATCKYPDPLHRPQRFSASFYYIK